jgi:multisubunit Na+/H+ antiporter MnhG subunit
MYREKMF